MIGRGDGDRVNIFVLEELAHVHVGFRLRQAQVLHVAEAQVQNALIHIAEGGNFRSRNMREALEVIIAATAQSANGDAHAIIRAKNFAAKRERGCADGDCFSGGLEEVAPIDRHSCLPLRQILLARTRPV